MQKYSKLSLILFFIMSVCIILYIVTAMYILDPLQVWHKSFLNSDTCSYTIRESAKAFIRDYEFNSAILGNSHSENTSAKKTAEILGGKFINLSMSGSTLDEKYILLKYLLKHKKLRQVVYLLDTRYYGATKTDTSNFNFLYDDNSFNDVKIYLNSRYFLCAVGLAKKSQCKINKFDIDAPYRWDNQENYTRRFGGFNKWLEYKDDKQVEQSFEILLKTPKEINNKKPDEKYHKDLENYINEYLLNIVHDNPNIKFYIIVSPVSDIELARSIRDEGLIFAKTSLLLDMFIKFQKNHNNFEVYAFDDTDTTGNIENYKDLTHYNSDINYLIINSIAKKEHQINAQNKNQYIEKTYNKAKNIDYDYYLNEIQKIKSSSKK